MTRVPFHVLLVAILPVISGYAGTPGAGHPEELMIACRIVLIASALLLGMTSIVYRDVRKAALCVSLFVVAVVLWRSWYEVVEHIRIGGLYVVRRRYVLPLTYLVLGAWSVWIYRQRARIPGLTGLANMVALGAVLPPSIVLGMQRTVPADNGTAQAETVLVAKAPISRPDIYYMVFDRYGSDETTRAYGLDNDVDEYLESRGFYVARESRSNYIKTVLSLGSTLNLEYLDDIARGREEASSLIPLYEHIAHHRVGAFLRSQGYSYTHLGSWYWPTRENPQATRNITYYHAVPSSVMRLLDSVMFAPVQRALHDPWFDYRLQIWHNVRRQLEDVARLVREPGPKFVFFHVLVPHPPYVFDRDGSYVTADVESERSFEENYRNQVLAANGMIRGLVDSILRDSGSPPVIIIQGDEGPYPPGTSSHRFNWHHASLDLLRRRSGILNAYHLPGVETRELYPTISPVNSFRVVFNAYFGTGLPLLPDRTFRHATEDRPYAFEDITRQLKSSGRATWAQEDSSRTARRRVPRWHSRSSSQSSRQ